jgi:hypothetical protein
MAGLTKAFEALAKFPVMPLCVGGTRWVEEYAESLSSIGLPSQSGTFVYNILIHV